MSVQQNIYRQRVQFSKIRSLVPIPNLIDIQKRSYDEFLQMNLLHEEREFPRVILTMKLGRISSPPFIGRPISEHGEDRVGTQISSAMVPMIKTSFICLTLRLRYA